MRLTLQRHRTYRRFRSVRRGYVMLVALILMAILSVIGATSLSVAGVDQRIAYHNRKHTIMVNTAIAGTDHGRNRLEFTNPNGENLDSAAASDTSTTAGADSTAYLVTRDLAETTFEGITFSADNSQNLGVYWVEAIFIKCGVPPPGYSTEEGSRTFRSDYWNLSSTSAMLKSDWSSQNRSEGRAVSSVRKVTQGSCKIR
jgi:hypothetical protein